MTDFGERPDIDFGILDIGGFADVMVRQLTLCGQVEGLLRSAPDLESNAYQ
jgi:hypothetical protein